MRRRLSLLPCLLFLILVLAPASGWAGTEFAPSPRLESFKTPHFTVVYVPGEGEEVAREVGVVAEEVRTELGKRLGLEPPAHYTLLVLDNYDTANGSSSGFPTQTIRLYLETPNPPLGGVSDPQDGMGETWMWQLLTHEYTHAIHLSRLTGWVRPYARVFRSTPYYLLFPGWFVEGIAVAMETELGRRGRGRASSTDMMIRADVLEGGPLPMNQWGYVNGWPRGGSRYLYGGAFMWYIRQRFGPEVIRKVIDATNAQVPWVDDVRFEGLADLVERLGGKADRLRGARLGGIERGFLKATGIPLSTLEKDWRQASLERYFHQQSLVREAGQTQLKLLTTTAGSTRTPTLIPGSRQLLWLTGGDSSLPGLLLGSLDGERPRRMSDLTDIYGPMTVSPDGKTMIFSRLIDKDSPLARVESRADLFAMDLNSRQVTRLTTGRRAHDPAFSPDGKQVYAISRGQGQTRLVRLNPDGTGWEVLFSPDRQLQLGTPAVSPDGTKVALSVFVQQEPPGIGLYRLGIFDLGTRRLTLLPGEAVEQDPAWVNDAVLLFVSDRNGINNLFTYHLGEGKARAVTNLLTGAFQPVVVPGVHPQVIFRHYSSRGFDLAQLSPTPLEQEALEGRGEGRVLPQVVAPDERVGDPRLVTRTAQTVTAGKPALQIPPTPSPAEGVAIEAPSAANLEGAPQSAVESAPLQGAPQAVQTLAQVDSAEKLGARLDYPARKAQIWRALPHLKVAGVGLLSGIDEGRGSYEGGSTLGVAFGLSEPIHRHSLYFEASWGLRSQRPSGVAVYTNRGLGLPMTFYGELGSTPTGLVVVDDTRYIVWERFQGGGLGLSLPFTRGQSSLSAGLDASAWNVQIFDGTNETGLWGREADVSQYVSWARYSGNAWRVPAQGQFFSLSTSQQLLSLTDGVESGQRFRWQVVASYSARLYLGRGGLDLDLQAGHRSGSDWKFLAGGNEGSWGLPGVTRENGVEGANLGAASLSVVQDLWRPEFALGQVPWLYLERVEGILSLSAAQALDDGFADAGAAAGAAFSLRARMFSLREGFSFWPSLGVGTDLRTGELTWWFSLGGWPDIYGALVPDRGGKPLEPWQVHQRWGR